MKPTTNQNECPLCKVLLKSPALKERGALLPPHSALGVLRFSFLSSRKDASELGGEKQLAADRLGHVRLGFCWGLGFGRPRRFGAGGELGSCVIFLFFGPFLFVFFVLFSFVLQVSKVRHGHFPGVEAFETWVGGPCPHSSPESGRGSFGSSFW